MNLLQKVIDGYFGQAIDNDSPRKMSKNVMDYIVGPEEKALMKFHGITGMESSPDKMQSFFVRKGKKIPVKLSPAVYNEMLKKYDPSR
jgi:hypothetical protein